MTACRGKLCQAKWYGRRPASGGWRPIPGDCHTATPFRRYAEADPFRDVSLWPVPAAVSADTARNRLATPGPAFPALSGTSSTGTACDRGPRAEPLFGAPGLEPLYLGEPQLRSEAHRAGVGGLSKEHHQLAGKLAGEPAECRSACLGGVPESPRLRQELVAELGLPGAPLPRCSPENDLANHGSVEIDHEKAGRPL